MTINTIQFKKTIKTQYIKLLTYKLYLAQLNGKKTNYVVLNGVSSSNDPVGAIKMNWDALKTGVYIAKISCGGEYAALILKTSQTFGAAHIIGYLESAPIYLTLHSGNWSEY